MLASLSGAALARALPVLELTAGGLILLAALGLIWRGL
jgi:hypothetical protein